MQGNKNYPLALVEVSGDVQIF
uniref:Uncharacterized protein n=1 Tax=Anguilla anguilla TaxID=7936 RepID=A0A0E9W1S1_ANGAN